MDNRWMRHFVFNVKLPQEQPLEALQPMIAYLEKVPDLRWRMRQLYHDRREVTVWGWLPV
jgi:23S rRNA C2498 (ribose-2'-O)-methylase RlmM